MNSGETSSVERALKALHSVGTLVIEGNRDPEQVIRYIQPVIGQPETYAAVLDTPPRQASFVVSFEPELWVMEWERFYREVYDLKDVNLLSAFRQPTEHMDHAWPVFCDRVSLNRTWAECRNLHSACSYLGDDLQKAVAVNDRSADTNGLYMVRFRARVEADVEYKGLSANVLAKRGVQCITLNERLKLEQFIWWKTGGFHLDMENVTLCAGSRAHDGYVPGVYWSDSQLNVYHYDPDDGRGGIRARSAVL